MKEDFGGLAIDLDRPYEGIGLSVGRKPQPHRLTGSLIVSSDNHIGLGGEDFFYENAPEALKDRVPRIFFDEENGHWTSTFMGRPVYPVGLEQVINSVEGREGIWNLDVRMAEMEAEGVSMEVAFPQVLPLTLFKLPDYEAREYIMAEYSRHLARLQRRAPGRFYGVGVPNYWEPSKARASIMAMKDDGLKILMLPCNPGDFPNGEKIRYVLDEMRPLWAAIAEADMTICFHIGENPGFGSKGGFATGVMNNASGPDFRQLWSQLVFGGVLDEFPDLRVVFSEANLHWIPGMLQDADMIPESFAGLLDYIPKLRPSAYWRRNCYATFIHDPAGLRLLDKIGAHTAMWSVDYPHNEGAFGYTGSAIQSIIEQVGEETARLLCGDNARACYRI